MGLLDTLFGKSDAKSQYYQGDAIRRQWNPLKRPLYDWERESGKVNGQPIDQGRSTNDNPIDQKKVNDFLVDGEQGVKKGLKVGGKVGPKGGGAPGEPDRISFWKKALGF